MPLGLLRSFAESIRDMVHDEGMRGARESSCLSPAGRGRGLVNSRTARTLSSTAKRNQSQLIALRPDRVSVTIVTDTVVTRSMAQHPLPDFVRDFVPGAAYR